MAIVKIVVISLLFLFSDAARFPNTVYENMVVSRDALDTSALAHLQLPAEKQEAGTEPNETVALVLRPMGNKETETESSLPSDKKEKEKEMSVSLTEHSFEHLRLFRPCHPRRHRHRFRVVDVGALTFGDDVTSSRKHGKKEGDSTEEAAKHTDTVTVTSTTEVAVHEELVNREVAEGDQDATKERRAQKVEEAKTTPTKIILPESNKEREDGGRKKKDKEDSDSDSDDEMEMEMEMRKRKKEKKGGRWKWFWGLWD